MVFTIIVMVIEGPPFFHPIVSTECWVVDHSVKTYAGGFHFTGGFTASWAVEFYDLSFHPPTLHETHFNGPRRETEEEARRDLEQRPLGSQFPCFYNQVVPRRIFDQLTEGIHHYRVYDILMGFWLAMPLLLIVAIVLLCVIKVRSTDTSPLLYSNNNNINNSEII